MYYIIEMKNLIHSDKIINYAKAILAMFLISIVATCLHKFPIDNILNVSLTFIIFFMISILIIYFRLYQNKIDYHHILKILENTFDSKFIFISFLNFLRISFLFIALAQGFPGAVLSLYLTLPVWVALLLKFKYNVPLDKKIYYGIICTLFGVIILCIPSIREIIRQKNVYNIIPLILPILAAIIMSIIMVFFKHKDAELSAYDDIYLQFSPIIGVFTLFLILLFSQFEIINTHAKKINFGIQNINLKNIFVMIGIFMTIYYTGYILFNQANNELDPVEFACLQACLPIFGFILGHFVLKNPISKYKIIGAFFIVIGTVYVSINLSKKHHDRHLK